MTLIVDALNRAARQCSLGQPASWLTATDLEHVELRDDFLLETADDVLERVDLPSPISAETDIGDGSETYTLPEDFKRLQRDPMAVYDTALDLPCVPVTNDGNYTALKDLGTAGTVKYFRLTGYEGNWSISFERPPSTTITVHYATVNWMADSSGTAGSAFTDAEDVLLLPRRVVEAGMVWRFRERKGLPYLDKKAEYDMLLNRMDNDRRARRVISMAPDKSRVRWQDMVPNFIPES